MRAELFSSDFLVSFFIFLSAIIIINFYYQNLQSDIYEVNTRNDMYSKAINAAELVASTSGYPEFWDHISVRNIGLYDSGKFNLTKFEELKQINYQDAKKMLGVGVYNFLITLKNETGSVIENQSETYLYGASITNAEQVVSIKRLGISVLNSTSMKTILEVSLWL